MVLYYATTYYAVRTSATARILFLEGTGSSLLDEANKGSQSRAFIFCHFEDLKFGPTKQPCPDLWPIKGHRRNRLPPLPDKRRP